MYWDDEIFCFFGFYFGSFLFFFFEYFKYVYVNDQVEVEQFFEEVMSDGKLYIINYWIVIDNKKVCYVQVNVQVSYVEKDGQMMFLGSIQDVFN